MITIALTGGFASGKSSFAKALSSLNKERWLVIDENYWNSVLYQDEIYKEELVDIFGADALINNEVNVDLVARQRVEDPVKDGRCITAFYHGMLRVWANLRPKLEAAGETQVVMLEIPLYFELNGGEFNVDRICSVICSPQSQIKRGCTRKYMLQPAVIDIIQSQVSNEFRIINSHYTFVNEYNNMDTLMDLANYFYNLVMKHEVNTKESMFT